MVDVVDLLNSALVAMFELFENFGGLMLMLVLVFAGLAVAVSLVRIAVKQVGNA